MGLKALRDYLRDKRIPTWRRWLLFFGLAYTLLPFDVIPDVIPVVGWLDDVGVLAMIAMFLSRDVARREARVLGEAASPPEP
jgi:uncharacterized membrane protein YkvA (DUF1232 family)